MFSSRPYWPLFGLILLGFLAGCTLPALNSNEGSEETIGGAPVINIGSPRPNATYLQNVAVNIQVSVSNAGEGISQLEFAVDGDVIASLANPNPAGAAVFSGTQTWPATQTGSHTISVAVVRDDGTRSAPASVSINVIEETVVEDRGILDEDTETPEPADPQQQSAEEESTPTEADPPTDAPTNVPPTDAPAEPAATETPSVPMAFFVRGVNVRSGPGLNFAPPIGAFAANQTAEILGLNLDGTWLKVRYNTREAWVFADLVEIQGNIANLPREAGPPTPPPPTETPIPATATPAVSANLVVFNHFSDPPVPQCGQNVRMGMSIRNDSNVASSTGTGRIVITRASDGAPIASSENAFVPVQLEPGGVHAVVFDFNISVYINELHRVEFIADVNNEVAETNENDNRQVIEYTLPANC